MDNRQLLSRDPLFNDLFFIEPEAAAVEVNINFPLPPSKQTFNEFLVSPAFGEFKQGVKQSINQLKEWVDEVWGGKNKDKNIELRARLHQDLDHFFKEKFDLSIDQIQVGTSYFELYTDGMASFAKMRALLQSEATPLDTRKNTVLNLIDGLNVCAPGCYMHIVKACDQLAVDLPNQLMALRRQLAEDAAQKLVQEDVHLNQYPANEIHYVTSVLNHFSKPLGIAAINDHYALDNIPENHDLYPVLQWFSAGIKDSMSVFNVINSILAKIDIQTLTQGVNGDHSIMQIVKALEETLTSYGSDPEFATYDLIREKTLTENKEEKKDEEQGNDQYTFKSPEELEHYLRVSLLHRLSHSEYINPSVLDGTNIASFTNETNKSKALVLLPGDLALSFLIFQEEDRQYRKPLIPYLLEQSQQGKTEDLALIFQQEGRQEEFINHYFQQVPKTAQAAVLWQMDPMQIIQDEGLLRRLYGQLSQENCKILVSLFKPYPYFLQVLTDLAASNNHASVIQELANVGVNLNEKDEEGWTVLHLAAHCNKREAIEVLIKLGAELNETSTDGLTPLDIAIKEALRSRSADVVVIEALVEAGASSNQGSSLAAVVEVHDLIKLYTRLSEQGGKALVSTFKTRADFLQELVYLAVEESNINLIRELAKLGVDLNKQNADGLTPLHMAVEYNQPAAIEALAELGANLNEQNRAGFTSLHVAAECNQLASITALAKAGANLNEKDLVTGGTAVHKAVESNQPEAIEVLAKAGANLNEKDSIGNTALHIAVENGSATGVEALARAGASLNQENNRGVTPAYLALPLETVEILDLLAKNKVDLARPVTVSGHCKTLLEFAEEAECRPETISFLVKHEQAILEKGKNLFERQLTKEQEESVIHFVEAQLAENHPLYPFKNHIAETKNKDFLSFFGRSGPPLEEYMAVLLLMGARTKEEFKENLLQIPPKLKQEGNWFADFLQKAQQQFPAAVEQEKFSYLSSTASSSSSTHAKRFGG